MGTLAELKRRLQVGTKVIKTYGIRPDANPLKTVALVQSNAIAFGEPGTPKGSLSWLKWPKAAQVKYEGDTFTILHPVGGEKVLEYRFC